MCTTVVQCRCLHPCLGWYPFLWEKGGLVINLGLSNNNISCKLIYMKSTEPFNLCLSWYTLMGCNTRVCAQSQIHHLFIWAHFHSRLSQQHSEIIRRRKVWFCKQASKQTCVLLFFQKDSLRRVYPKITSKRSRQSLYPQLHHLFDSQTTLHIIYVAPNIN